MRYELEMIMLGVTGIHGKHMAMKQNVSVDEEKNRDDSQALSRLEVQMLGR